MWSSQIPFIESSLFIFTSTSEAFYTSSRIYEDISLRFWRLRFIFWLFHGTLEHYLFQVKRHKHFVFITNEGLQHLSLWYPYLDPSSPCFHLFHFLLGLLWLRRSWNNLYKHPLNPLRLVLHFPPAMILTLIILLELPHCIAPFRIGIYIRFYPLNDITINVFIERFHTT